MTIKLTLKIVQLYDHCHSNDLDAHSRLQVLLKRDYILTCSISDPV